MEGQNKLQMQLHGLHCELQHTGCSFERGKRQRGRMCQRCAPPPKIDENSKLSNYKKLEKPEKGKWQPLRGRLQQKINSETVIISFFLSVDARTLNPASLPSQKVWGGGQRHSTEQHLLLLPVTAEPSQINMINCGRVGAAHPPTSQPCNNTVNTPQPIQLPLNLAQHPPSHSSCTRALHPPPPTSTPMGHDQSRPPPCHPHPSTQHYLHHTRSVPASILPTGTTSAVEHHRPVTYPPSSTPYLSNELSLSCFHHVCAPHSHIPHHHRSHVFESQLALMLHLLSCNPPPPPPIRQFT
jgi:hypothetical protein